MCKQRGPRRDKSPASFFARAECIHSSHPPLHQCIHSIELFPTCMQLIHCLAVYRGRPPPNHCKMGAPKRHGDSAPLLSLSPTFSLAPPLTRSVPLLHTCHTRFLRQTFFFNPSAIRNRLNATSRRACARDLPVHSRATHYIVLTVRH